MEPTLATWHDLPSLDPIILETLNKLNFTNVTKVQNAVIPLFLQNKDVCVKACTGSGKTLAFTLPLIQSLLKRPKTQNLAKNDVLALIIAPSRELAI